MRLFSLLKSLHRGKVSDKLAYDRLEVAKMMTFSQSVTRGLEFQKKFIKKGQPNNYSTAKKAAICVLREQGLIPSKKLLEPLAEEIWQMGPAI